MASIKISDLPSVSTITDSDIMPIVNGDDTKKVLISQLKELFGGDSSGSNINVYEFEITDQVFNYGQSFNTTNKTKLQTLLNDLYTNGIKTFSLLVTVQDATMLNDKLIKYQFLMSPNRNTIELTNKPTYLSFGGLMRPGWLSDTTIGYFSIIASLTWSGDTCTVSSAEYNWTVTSVVSYSDVLTKTNVNYYVPTSNYHPATKKYVDDKIWIGTQAQYDALSSHSNSTIYFIKES